ncbi:hypothetical protein BFJ69_g6348 [Fusarium oxysporum]|uniref:Uncharacterized protein n=1 Tax=Fusarium oxysporum TaxID=5507 RepID=A0A420NAQ8_FUSOX|nr:hypothetical protein BFJ69_g6348 [Fusarium oxysporum]
MSTSSDSHISSSLSASVFGHIQHDNGWNPRYAHENGYDQQQCFSLGSSACYASLFIPSPSWPERNISQIQSTGTSSAIYLRRRW